MGSTNFVDLEERPDTVTAMVDMLVRNTSHLANFCNGIIIR